jgi:hypothetical protein
LQDLESLSGRVTCLRITHKFGRMNKKTLIKVEQNDYMSCLDSVLASKHEHLEIWICRPTMLCMYPGCHWLMAWKGMYERWMSLTHAPLSSRPHSLIDSASRGVTQSARPANVYDSLQHRRVNWPRPRRSNPRLIFSYIAA